MNSVLVTNTAGAAVLKLCGELDMAMAPMVRIRFAALDGDVELDCAGLTFMDCAGVSVFVEMNLLCTGRGAKLTVVNAPRCVTWLLALTNLEDAFDVRSEDAGA